MPGRCWIGAALIAVACVGFWLAAVVGDASARLLDRCSASATSSAWPGTRCWRCARRVPRARESVLGYYMIAAAIGQGTGPFLVGWLGGSAAVPPTGQLFAISLGIAVASVAVALAIRPAARGAGHGDARRRHPDRHAHAAARPAGRDLRQRGDGDGARPPGDLSAAAGRRAADRFERYRHAADRALGRVAGVAHVLCPDDLRLRPRAAHAREHAGARRGLHGAGAAAARCRRCTPC